MSAHAGDGAREEASDAFSASRGCFEEIADWLDGDEATGLSHGELEDQLETGGRQLLRRMFQDHLDLRAQREERVEVIDADGVAHGTVEAEHHRRLTTVFGTVTVERLAYRHRGRLNLYPADAVLNLPAEHHSHGLRRLAAVESTRGSFEGAQDAIERTTGVSVAKRQVEELAASAAVDIDEFYATVDRDPTTDNDDVVVVLSADGKGIVMRPDSLRPATAKAAASSTPKLSTRLSKGEKRNRKRLAEVGAVYDITPVPRSPTDVLASQKGHDPPPAPEATAKWVTASVVEDAAVVVTKVFDEAERRDPDHQRPWIALVDGNNHQIDRINAEASTRDIRVSIVVDLCRAGNYADRRGSAMPESLVGVGFSGGQPVVWSA